MSPLICVSDPAADASPGPVDVAALWACRIIKVKLKTSSSSFESFRRKFGAPFGCNGSVSWQRLVSITCISQALVEGRTCTNSSGLLSPDGRDADTLLAGNALGTMLMELRFFGLEIRSDDMLTAKG